MLIAAMLLPGVARADKVTPDVARRAAHNFLFAQRQQIWTLSQSDATVGIGNIYLFTAEEGGFVLLAGDDCVRPILGYSLESRIPDTLPEHVWSWMAAYGDEVGRLCAMRMEPSDMVRREWHSLLEPSEPQPLYTVAVAPMLTTQWRQSTYYNSMCPYNSSSGQRTLAGCVAVAMAQVMRYWQHPQQGTGSNTYTSSTYGTISADFGNTTYAWSDMPATLTATSSDAAVAAVATLVFHAGVSVNMSYGTSASSATTASSNNINTVTAERALRTYFGYTPTLHSIRKEALGDSLWMDMLNTELVAGRPVLYSGHDTSGGHSFVCDGSDSSGHYHFNWGWGGYCDGYYLIGALNPAPGGAGGNATSHYNLTNRAIIGIRPATQGITQCTVAAVPDSASHGSVNGGGTYTVGDTVQLTAMANIGYRFERWNDGMCYNPRKMIAGEDVAYTAIYEKVGGDTLRYDNGIYVTAWGYSSASPYYWGVCYDTGSFAAHNRLDAVMAYLKAGSYSLYVYQGATPSDSTLVDSRGYVAAGSSGWHTIPLASPSWLDSHKPLWIVLRCSDIAYPACAGVYCGHQMAAYANNNGTNWNTVSTTRTFLLRAIVSTIPSDTIVREVCDSLRWNDTLLTSSGTYFSQLTTSGGTDSVVVLLLTVHPSYHQTDTVVSEGPYVWSDGVQYDSGGVYTFAGQSVYGCDSVRVLHLTVTQPETGVRSVDSGVCKVLPNPATQTISFDGIRAETVEVYDVVGRLVLSSKACDSIDISSLPQGLYRLHLNTSTGNRLSASFVKQ